MYEIEMRGASPPVLLTAGQLLRLENRRGQYDGIHRTAGWVWFWAAWRQFQYVRGTARKAA